MSGYRSLFKIWSVRMARVIPKIVLGFGLIGFAATPAFASYAVFIGSNLTEDGSTMLGGTGDEPSSHWLEIVPHRSWPAESTIGGDARCGHCGAGNNAYRQKSRD